MSPEQEAKLLEAKLKQAAASGDIGTILKEMTRTAELSPADFIKKTVGNLLFTYYTYVDRFHQRPRDMEDLVDGLLYLSSYDYLIKRESDK